MNDRQQIERVLADFCIGVDRVDFELLESCFHADAEANFGGFVNGPVGEYFEFVKSDDGLRSFERTMHNLGTSSIEVEGDVAWAQSYCVAFHEGAEDHPWCQGFVVIYARYADRFERRDGRWAISARTCVFEWSRNQTTGEDLELPADNIGRRDRADLTYRR